MLTANTTAEWIVGGDLNMVEWSGDRDGGVGSVVSGQEKQAWSHCKAALHVFDPNWRKRNLDYGGWFAWCNFRQGRDSVKARLDHFYGPRMGWSFQESSSQLMC